MSTSSKYANLPFIASGEKDIFETDDLPEADQVSIQQPLYDASVEIIPTGTVDAYQKFAASVNNESLKFEVFKCLFCCFFCFMQFFSIFRKK